MSNLNEIKEKWKKNGFSDTEIEKLLSTLKEIYIGQHIREEGILQFEFKERKKEIEILMKDNLVKENRWYSHSLFLTTSKGSETAKEYIEMQLKEKHKIFLEILISEYFAKQLSFSCEGEYFFDWRAPLFKDSRILICRNKILRKLEESGFCTKTHMYVSTRGGELRDLHYLISPEVQRELLKAVAITPQTVEVINRLKRKLTIYFFLADRILPFVRPPEERNEDIINMYRQEFWNQLEALCLTEEDIKPVIDELSKKKITTNYRGLLAKDLPFEVKDEIGYKKLLKEELVEPVISFLLEEKMTMFTKSERKEMKIERLPTEIVSQDEFFKFFNELGSFEIKVRNFIARELGDNLENADHKKGDVKNLIEKLKEWKNREKSLIGLSKEPLINYASFGDYITLITSHWERFQKYFVSEEEATIPLSLINILARRPLAHFRALTLERIKRAREEMRRFLAKIEVKTYERTRN